MENKPKYDFSSSYTDEHAQEYFKKFRRGLPRLIANLLEKYMVYRALKAISGKTSSILDYPCGTGRFWNTIGKFKFSKFYVADYNKSMISVGLNRRGKVVSKITDSFRDSIFKTILKTNFVDVIASIRFIHHISKSEDRIKVLKEYRRITKKYLIISLWTDGNYLAYRHKRKLIKKRKKDPAYQPRDRVLIPQKQFLKEVELAGFKVEKRISMLPLYEKWNIFILKK